MSTRKTILVHGTLTAAALAVVGYLFAQMAGMWVASQSPSRGDLPSTSVDELKATLAWRVPFAMAAMGFVLVAMGEGVKSLWRKPKAVPEPAPAESEMQRMLREIETKAEQNTHQPA